MNEDERTRRLVQVFFLLNLLQGYLWAINGTASKYIREEFALSESALAFAFGVFASGSLGTLWLSRLADRHGRRRLTLLACAAAPLLAVASGLAPGIVSYVAVQIGVVALIGTLFAVSVVVITEELPDDARAKAQGWVGLASGLGSGLVLVLVAGVVLLPGGWRWLWAPVVPMIFLLPRLRRFLPETDRFRKAEQLGETQSAEIRELWHSRYRGRAIGIFATAFLGNAANVAAMTWGMYHLLENLELPQAEASAIFVIGGALAVLGFPLGGRWSDDFGRRHTAALGSLISTIFAIGFFWIPRESPMLVPLLAITFGINGLFRTAKMIAWRTSATELFPTRLRAAVQGLSAVMASLSGIFAQFTMAALAPLLGGLVEAASVVILLGIPAAIAFWWFVPETAGVELESAALEDRAAAAYVGLGSNLGDRAGQLDRALGALGATPGITVTKTSALYETDPVGGPPGQGLYLNAVAVLTTTLAPRALLERLLAIELEAGRARRADRDAPRELDLDLLIYDEVRIDEPDLVVPHPRLHERGFVLEPLRDVAPDLVHPVIGEDVVTLAARVRDENAVRPYSG